MINKYKETKLVKIYFADYARKVKSIPLINGEEEYFENNKWYRDFISHTKDYRKVFKNNMFSKDYKGSINYKFNDDNNLDVIIYLYKSVRKYNPELKKVCTTKRLNSDLLHTTLKLVNNFIKSNNIEASIEFNNDDIKFCKTYTGINPKELFLSL